MKRKLTSIILVLAFVLSPASTFAVSAADTDKPDVLRSIFGGIDDIEPDEKALDLPYLDGTVLSDVREPIYMYNGASKLLGESSFASDSISWKNSAGFTLKSGNVTINGKIYNIGSEFKLLNASEGDFNNDGKKGELAVLAAAKTTDNKSLLLLCTASAAERDGVLSPIAVLYSGTMDFYNNIREFANCMEIVCADVNGDGYDEIVTATPTSGYTAQTFGTYKIDKHNGAYLWSLEAENRDAISWKTAGGWQQNPSEIYTGMNMSYGENCYIGAPGTTAALAAGDVDGDGYDDLVTAFSTTKAQYNANYSSNLFSVYYIGGAPTVSEMVLKRNALMRYVDGEVKNNLYLGVTSGDAAGFDVDICDIDGSGKPTIFLSFKETVHRWQAMSGNFMYTPRFYIYSFDMKNDYSKFTASLIHKGGIYHHGWRAGGEMNDTCVFRTDPIDCAPVRIGVLKKDFGLSEGKSGYASSGTIIADQKYFSFVRYPDGDKYRYEPETKSMNSYTGDWGKNREDNGHGFADRDCVFYRNGINVTDIKTANVRFDGTTYEDAALVSAYTDDGYRTYCFLPNGSGYSTSTLSQSDTAYAAAAMPDTDNDSIYLKYNKHVFFWADPVIIAALASPPYFDSLPSDMYGNSQTTYGKSLTSSTGNSESYTVSAGTYISTEVKAGGGGTAGVFEMESEAMKNSSLGREENAEVSYTQSFSANGGSDTVVLSTVAYDAYSYTAYYSGENGELAESPYIVYVPRGGAGAIKIASLNYDDYTEFAGYAEGALPDLDDVFTHTVGKPETYPQSTPSGANVLNGSILTHPKLAGFPSDESSQTLSIDITKETTETTSSGSSVSVKLGGGYEAEAEDIFGLVNVGSQITGGSATGREYESGRIKTSAVGTSIEGTVFGQGDGMNVSGTSKTKAEFSWRLLHYIHNFKDGNSVQQFPVVTYITSGVSQPVGVVPERLSVSPLEMSVEQVGPKTVGYVNEVGFNADIQGVTREAYTALEGAPLGMSANTGGSNIGTSGIYPFGVKINSNVKPGRYDLLLNVGGVRSNPFTVIVDEYTDPIWIEADKTELDFGSMRYNYSKGTPAAEAQAVTIKNIHTEQINNLSAEVDADGDFVIAEELSSKLLYAKGLENSTATVKVAPKSGLDVGTHTGILKVSNGVTSAFVSLKYTVTEPTLPQAPDFEEAMNKKPNPLRFQIGAPDDDGGGKMLYYLYTIKGHENYVKDGMQIWEKSYNTTQSGNSFFLFIPEELTVGEKYTIGVKAKTTCGESEAAWFEFEVSQPPNDPDPVKNVKVYPGNGSITVTWDAPDSWGENEYNPTIPWKWYQIWFSNADGGAMTGNSVELDQEHEWTRSGLENGTEYKLDICSYAVDREAHHIVNVTPSAEVIAPSRPTYVKAEMSYKKAVLSWKAPCYTGNQTVTYQISKDGGASWENVTAEPDQDGVVKHTFENLVTNREYDFRVRAINSKGTGDSAILVETAPPKLIAPTIDSVTRGYEQLELIWLPVEGATGYEVKLDEGEWQPIEPILYDEALHYLFTGLENDREYSMYVRGVDEEGGGNIAARKHYKPSSRAPLPPINPRVEPRNGGIQFFAEKHDPNDTLQYKADGGRYWWSFSGSARLNGFENGKEYTAAIATEGKDENNMTVRTTVYLTVTPDASIPDPPDAPVINAFIGDDYIRIVWGVENDGGAPITHYEVSVDDGDPITLPATEMSLVVNRSDLGESNYLSVDITAFNSAGSSSNERYLNFGGKPEGMSSITLPSVRSENFSAPYKLTIMGYTGEDENGNPIWGAVDGSQYAEWNMTSDNQKITWNDESKCILIDKSLEDGIYSAVVTADYHGTTYEKNVQIVVGGNARIISAQNTADGITVALDLPEELGEKTLCAALYDSSHRLLKVVVQKVSNSSLTGGKVIVRVDSSKAALTKVMLLDSLENMQPLCESKKAE